MVQEIAKIIRQFKELGFSVLLIEQNAVLALHLADQAYVLETGSIALQGSRAGDAGQRHVKRPTSAVEAGEGKAGLPFREPLCFSGLPTSPCRPCSEISRKISRLTGRGLESTDTFQVARSATAGRSSFFTPTASRLVGRSTERIRRLTPSTQR
jgi:energy-coupling factor transporter ATP-binding protein EcfA2